MRTLGPSNPQVKKALSELKAMIRDRYPDAAFDIVEGYDPTGVYLLATVDVEDLDEVIDLVIDRLYDIQVERGLPVYVLPEPTRERLAAMWP